MIKNETNSHYNINQQNHLESVSTHAKPPPISQNYYPQQRSKFNENPEEPSVSSILSSDSSSLGGCPNRRRTGGNSEPSDDMNSPKSKSGASNVRLEKHVRLSFNL